MKILFQCEICQKLYQSMSEAEHCEAKGIPQDVPSGTIFTPAGKTDMVFAVVKNVRIQHMRWNYCFFASDLESGENYDSFDVNNLSLISPDFDSISPALDWPCTQRMLQTLKSKRMTARFFKAEDYARL